MQLRQKEGKEFELNLNFKIVNLKLSRSELSCWRIGRGDLATVNWPWRIRHSELSHSRADAPRASPHHLSPPAQRGALRRLRHCLWGGLGNHCLLLGGGLPTPTLLPSPPPLQEDSTRITPDLLERFCGFSLPLIFGGPLKDQAMRDRTGHTIWGGSRAVGGVVLER